jgi:hypothetical protein
MKVGKLLVLAAVLGLATGAGAATVFTGTNFAWDISTPTPVGTGAESLVAFTLTLVNTSGNPAKNPQAFDGAPDPNNPPGQSGISTVGNLLHNEQLPSFGSNHTTTPSATQWASWGLTPSSVDTRFLDLNDAMAIVFSPSEDNIGLNLPYSAEPGDYAGFGFRTGWSDVLTGTVSLKGQNPNPTWNMAYIVVPCNTVVRIDAQVAGGDGVKEDFDFEFPVACEVIPVPAALPLGFVGLLMAIRRR